MSLTENLLTGKAMKNLRIILGIAAFSMLTSACINEVELPSREQENRLTATIESSPETRTSLSPEKDGVSKVLWSSRDRIGVYVDGGQNMYSFTLADGEGTGQGVFTGYGNGSGYIAVYPESIASGIGDGAVSLTIPSEQTYAAGSFSSGSFPMVAVSNSTDLSFRHLCSVLKISITGHHGVTGLVFRANDPGVKVSGPATVSLADPSNPVLTMSEVACDSLVLKTDGVVLDDVTPTDFYMVLPAQTYKGGFTVRVYTKTGYMDKSLKSDFTMLRARKHDATPFTMKVDVGFDPSAYLSGSGTEADPFLVGSLGDLVFMRESINSSAMVSTAAGTKVSAGSSHYLLTADLDLSPICSEESGANWTPIGGGSSASDPVFEGVFDGGGHEISNLFISNKSGEYQGFFGAVRGVVRNLTVSGVIAESNSAGLIVGNNREGSLLENCISKGSVRGDFGAGGIASSNDGSIEFCRNEAGINGIQGVGGISGFSSSSSIRHCTNYGMVSGLNSCGGIAGSLSGGAYMTECTNYGVVDGVLYSGGIVGLVVRGSKVLNCINYGDTKGSEYVGGIGGLLSCMNTGRNGATTIANCINAGTVEISGDSYCGLVAGYAGLVEGSTLGVDDLETDAWVMNNYWLEGCGKGITLDVGGGTGLIEGNVGVTDAHLKGAKYDGVLFMALDGSTYDLLIDALNAGAVKWSQKWRAGLHGWEYSAPGLYPVQSDLPAQIPGSSKQVFEIDRSVFEFNVNENHFQVAVTSSLDYSVAALSDWISETSSETIPLKPHTRIHTFTVKANYSGKARKAMIEFTNSEGKVLRVRVSQKEPYLTVSDNEASFFVIGGSKTVTISSSMDWTACAGEENDWYSVSPSNGSGDGAVIVTVNANTGSSARAGYILISAADGSVVHRVSFIQSGFVIDDSEEWKELPFFRQSVIMRLTATWCNWCPYMGAAISRAQELYPGKIQHLALHGSDSDLEFAPSDVIIRHYGGGGFPTAVVDGRIKVSNNTDIEEAAANFVRICKETEETYGAATGMAIRSSVSGHKISVNVTGYFKEAGKYMISVFLVEDGIVNPQVNGGEFYVHDNVARVALTDPLGDIFSVKDDLSVREFNYESTVSPKIKTGNLRVLAFIQRPFGSMPILQTGDYGGFFIDNCATAPVGEMLKVALVGGTGGGGDDEGDGNEGVTPGGEID